jgi:hypothetical protein
VRSLNVSKSARGHPIDRRKLPVFRLDGQASMRARGKLGRNQVRSHRKQAVLHNARMRSRQ